MTDRVLWALNWAPRTVKTLKREGWKAVQTNRQKTRDTMWMWEWDDKNPLLLSLTFFFFFWVHSMHTLSVQMDCRCLICGEWCKFASFSYFFDVSCCQIQCLRWIPVCHSSMVLEWGVSPESFPCQQSRIRRTVFNRDTASFRLMSGAFSTPLIGLVLSKSSFASNAHTRSAKDDIFCLLMEVVIYLNFWIWQI